MRNVYTNDPLDQRMRNKIEAYRRMTPGDLAQYLVWVLVFTLVAAYVIVTDGPAPTWLVIGCGLAWGFFMRRAVWYIEVNWIKRWG